jgi:ADP-heptose:LPS heptosyltransferase
VSSPGACSRILICRPNARLGNALLLTPLVQELEATFPGAELDILTACPSAEEIFGEFACVRNIYRLPRRGARHPLRHLATLLRISRNRYDLIVDPCPKSWSSRFATRVMRGRVKLGFSSSHKSGGADLNVPLRGAPAHMGTYPVYLLRQGLGASRSDPPCTQVPSLSIALTAGERAFGRRKIAQLVPASGWTPILAVALCATGAKELSPEWWREMLQHVSTEAPEVRVIEIISETGVARLAEFPGYFSTRIRRLAAVIGAADCFVSADSGLMHLGAATNTTTVGLFNVTDPAVYAPYGGLNRALRVANHAPARVAHEVIRILKGGCRPNPVLP